MRTILPVALFVGLLLTQAVSGQERNAVILLLPVEDHSVVGQQLLDDLTGGFFGELRASRHFMIKTLANSDGVQLGRTPEFDRLSTLAKAMKVDQIFHLLVTKFVSKFIILGNLYSFSEHNPQSSTKTLKKVADQNQFNNPKFFRDFLEELFYPENIYQERGFLVLSEKPGTRYTLDEQAIDPEMTHISGLFALRTGLHHLTQDDPELGKRRANVIVRPGEMAKIIYPEEKQPRELPKKERFVEKKRSATIFSNPYLYGIATTVLVSVVLGYYAATHRPETVKYKVSFYQKRSDE